jgi:hypothetical protein
MPTEGINHMLNATFKGGTQYATWYCGLFEGNYTPTSADVASTFTSLATESTTYSESTRPEWVEGTVAAGTLDNSASRATFTSYVTKTLYGAFMTPSSAKGSTAGPLISVARFSSPKLFEAGTVLLLTGGFTMTSS